MIKQIVLYFLLTFFVGISFVQFTKYNDKPDTYSKTYVV